MIPTARTRKENIPPTTVTLLDPEVLVEVDLAGVPVEVPETISDTLDWADTPVPLLVGIAEVELNPSVEFIALAMKASIVFPLVGGLIPNPIPNLLLRELISSLFKIMISQRLLTSVLLVYMRTKEE